jgi:hypothetical protein
MDLGIKGKTALVCGASKGLGKGCAEALAADGVNLVLVARNAEALEKTAEDIRRTHGVNVTAVAADITTPEGRAQALAACPAPDILVTNAGGPPTGDFRDWGRDQWIGAGRQHADADRTDQGHGRRHDQPRLRPHRQHHLERGQGADRCAGPVQRRPFRPDRLRRRHRPQDRGVAREYFRQVDLEDLDERTPEDLLGALLSHWQFGAQRKPGAPKVRVFSPSPGEDGWGSRHTVVQVVNDDMPFLVDSVSMEIARQGLALHLIVHPIFAVSATPRACCSRWRRATRGARAAARIVDVHRGRPHGRRRSSAPRCARGHRARAGRRARRRGRLEADAGAAAGSHRRWPARRRAARRGGGRKPRLPAMAGRRPLHAARLPPARPGGAATASWR